MKDTCLNGMNDAEEISPLRGLGPGEVVKFLLQRSGSYAAGMCLTVIILLQNFI